MRDMLGAACSGLCMAHCIGLPLLLAAGAPIVGLSFVSDESVHLYLGLAIVVIALWSFPAGWRKHRRLLPAAFAVGGTTLLITSLNMPEAIEAYVTFASGAVLVTAHLLNHSLSKKQMDHTHHRGHQPG